MAMKTLFTNDINGKLRVVLLAVLWLIWSQEGQAANGAPRVVVVGGALTEIIYELGGESSIVGVDTTSQWPEAAKSFPQVGYQRSLSAEGVLSLKPDLVLATAEAGPPEVLEQIRGAGVTIQSFPENHSLAGVENRVLGIAESLGLESAGQRLVERLRAEMTAARELVSQASDSPRVLFLLAVGKGAPLASGEGTSAHAMIEMAGGENVFATMKGYKPVSG